MPAMAYNRHIRSFELKKGKASIVALSIGSHQNVDVLLQMNRMSFQRTVGERKKEGDGEHNDDEDEVIEQRMKRKTNRM